MGKSSLQETSFKIQRQKRPLAVFFSSLLRRLNAELWASPEVYWEQERSLTFFPLPIPQKRNKIKCKCRGIFAAKVVRELQLLQCSPVFPRLKLCLLFPLAAALNILKCVEQEEGKQEEGTLAFSWKICHFHQMLIQGKLFKGETRVSIWKCSCNAARKLSLGQLMSSLPGSGFLGGLQFLHWNDCAFSLSCAGKPEKTVWLGSWVYREQQGEGKKEALNHSARQTQWCWP